jgi:hypothetical protein
MTNFIDAYLCKISRAPQPIREPVAKLGGTPVLYDKVIWPTCHFCGQKMDFLAQIPLRNPIEFSHKYDMAYIFMCPGHFDERGWLQCQTWEPYAGANAVILQEHSSWIALPDLTATYPDYAVVLERISEPQIDTTDDLIDDDQCELIQDATKIGGVPMWIQTNETPSCSICHGSMKFVGQLHAALDGPLPADAHWGDSKYRFFNFGDLGLGYIFLCDCECSSEGAAFFWQSS